MALSDKDLNKISKVVKTQVSGLEIKVTKEFGLLRLEMNQRFDSTDKRISNVETNILTKIEEVKKMENEDILAVASDVAKIKKKIAFQQ